MQWSKERLDIDDFVASDYSRDKVIEQRQFHLVEPLVDRFDRKGRTTSSAIWKQSVMQLPSVGQ
jgi:hypothetical protein